jgi:hypothetical protein
VAGSVDVADGDVAVEAGRLGEAAEDEEAEEAVVGEESGVGVADGGVEHGGVEHDGDSPEPGVAGAPAPPASHAARLTRPSGPDPVCEAAVELARSAAVEEAEAPSLVGDYLGAEAEGDRLVLHRFACTSRAYPGWVWAVVVARASRMRKVTVDDVVLLPGDGALLAPEWVPWSERLRPGDVGVGDLLPTAADDPRLTLRMDDVEGGVDVDAWHEQGFGRARVLSALGREDAADRWYSGEAGPAASIARVAPASCLTCGFHVRLVGALGQLFGVCANELAPDDGRVTAVDHGCGAHSEALVAPSAHPEPVAFDDDPSDLAPTDVEVVDAAVVEAAAPAEAAEPVEAAEPAGSAERPPGSDPGTPTAADLGGQVDAETATDAEPASSADADVAVDAVEVAAAPPSTTEETEPAPGEPAPGEAPAVNAEVVDEAKPSAEVDAEVLAAFGDTTA